MGDRRGVERMKNCYPEESGVYHIYNKSQFSWPHLAHWGGVPVGLSTSCTFILSVYCDLHFAFPYTDFLWILYTMQIESHSSSKREGTLSLAGIASIHTLRTSSSSPQKMSDLFWDGFHKSIDCLGSEKDQDPLMTQGTLSIICCNRQGLRPVCTR